MQEPDNFAAEQLAGMLDVGTTRCEWRGSDATVFIDAHDFSGARSEFRFAESLREIQSAITIDECSTSAPLRKRWGTGRAPSPGGNMPPPTGTRTPCSTLASSRSGPGTRKAPVRSGSAPPRTCSGMPWKTWSIWRRRGEEAEAARWRALAQEARREGSPE